MRKICTACKDASASDRKYCHECKGLGYIDNYKKCAMNETECPWEYEPMVNGWLCNECGRSGPL